MPSNSLSISRLFKAERASIARMLGRMVDGTALDDALQTLSLRIQTLDEAPIANKRAYLFQLAANVAWDQGRAEARQRRLQVEAEAILWGPDRAPNADDVLIAREELERVAAAAQALPETTRTIFHLNRIEHLPQREIAHRLGVSRTTVEKHMRRAMLKLGQARNGE